ncbi:hypothetical protein OROGR_029062 [Orobanche gracilis]
MEALTSLSKLLHKASDEMNDLSRTPPRHEFKLILREIDFFSNPAFYHSFSKFHSMTEEFNTPVVTTILSITFVLEERNHNTMPPLHWHHSISKEDVEQRARLALARALYHATDIYLLDDILSAVDAHVGRSILQNVILGPLMNTKTGIFCTHNIQAIYLADVVVVMDKGQVQWVESPSDSSISSYISLLSLDEFNNSFTEVQNNKKLSSELEKTKEIECINNANDAQDIIEVETRKEGRVEAKSYNNYAAFAGWFITVLTCISAVMMQASRNGNDLWLSFWVDTAGVIRSKYSTTLYLVVLRLFCLIHAARANISADFLHRNRCKFVAFPSPSGYIDIPQEKLSGENLLDPNWPSKGDIQFKNVTFRYMPSLPPPGGSHGDNLDPFQMSSDEEICNTLEKCCLKEKIESAGGLDIHVKESGKTFSVGQRQLLCLAQALLKSSKVHG